MELNALHLELLDGAVPVDIVIVTDADGIVERAAFSELLGALASHPDAGVAWGVAIPDRRGLGRLASAFQMDLVARIARERGARALRAEGRLFAYRLRRLADFRWHRGGIADDTQIALWAAHHGVEMVTALGAYVRATPAGSYRDFYRQTYRFNAAVDRARRAGIEGDGGADFQRLLKGAALRQARADPLGAVAYIVARIVAAAMHRVTPTRLDDAWDPAASTKGPLSDRGQRGRWRRFAELARGIWSRLPLVTQATRTFVNWPSVIGRSALSYLRLGPGDMVARTRDGLVLRAPNDPMSRAPILELARDEYRFDDLMRSIDGREAVVIDVGAHVGTFALEIARRHPECRVTCFEPHPLTLPYLRRNVDENAMTDRVQVEPAAVGAVAGRGTLYDAGCASTLEASLGQPEAAAFDVEVISFGEVVRNVGGRVDLLKLDCEGAEHAIVHDTDPVLWQGIHEVILEHHPVTGRSWDALRHRLESLGFVLEWHKANRLERYGGELGVAHFVRADAARSKAS